MINTTYSKAILNAFFNTSNGDENNVSFPTTPYLALFTSGGAEPTGGNYNRVLLTTKGPKNLQIMSSATEEAGTDEYAGKQVAVIKNQDIIVFPECETSGYNAPVVGFGVFGSATGGTPILSGDLTESVTISQGEIPVFRVGQFVFKLA